MKGIGGNTANNFFAVPNTKKEWDLGGRKTSCVACRQKSTKKKRKEHWMLHSENVLIYFSCEDNVVTQQRFFSFEFRAFSNNDKMYLSASSS